MAAFQPRYVKHGGITVIQKHDPARRKNRPSKIALCLAGGAISGGAYKAGGLRALERFIASRREADLVSDPFVLNDFDIFVGLSAGAILASALAAGVSAEEVYQVTLGRSGEFEALAAWDFMRPNYREPLVRMRMFFDKATEVVGNLARRATNPHTGRGYSLGETVVKMLDVAARLSPTGLFDADGIRRYLLRQMRRSGLPDDFREAVRRTAKELYLTAVDINSGRTVVFGHNTHYSAVPISRAVAASCGLPGWYATVRIPNPRAGEVGERRFLDLIDGGVAKTANASTAIDRGADLVVVYNPFTPIQYHRYDRSLYEHGPYTLVSQLFRTLLGTRLDQAKQKFAIDPTLHADVVYIEPTEDDYAFFLMNPLNFWAKGEAAAHGYRSTKRALLENAEVLSEVFANHGIRLSADALARSSDLERAAAA